MKSTNKCFLIFILLIIFAIYVIWDERKTLFNLRFNKIKEALQNYEEPIVDYDGFLEDIQSSDSSTEYGGTPRYQDFSNVMSYNQTEVSQDIKYFNNASNLLFGLKVASGNYDY